MSTLQIISMAMSLTSIAISLFVIASTKGTRR